MEGAQRQVFISADGPDVLDASLAGLADHLFPGEAPKEQADRIAMVMNWLRAHSDWLLKY